MCTSILLPCPDGRCLFGRTLDWCEHFGERPTRTPRGFAFDFGRRIPHHALAEDLPRENRYAMAGTATDCGGRTGGYPLYADAMNERGLCMAGLRFAKGAVYAPVGGSSDTRGVDLAPWELIPYVLGLCATVSEAREALAQVRLVDAPFPTETGSIPTSLLHWHIASTAPSGQGPNALVVEQTADGLCVYEDGLGVLTNDPTYPEQMENFRRFECISEAPDLPGDYASTSRFVRAAVWRPRVMAALPALTPAEPVARCFHLLASVAPPPGCGAVTPDGRAQHTLYAVCMDGSTGLCHYLTETGERVSVRVDSP